MGNAKFSDDFKRDALHQIAVWGYPVREVSHRMGVSTHSLYAWVKKFSKVPDADSKDDHHVVEYRRPKRELARVTEERDILKKATVYFARNAKCSMRLSTARQGIAWQSTRGEAYRPLFSIRTMCRVLLVHPSGFYSWLKNPLSKRAVEDRRQTKLIKEAWEESGKVYGYPLASR